MPWFVDPARSLIAQERGAQVWEHISPALHEYVSRPAFERACRDFLWHSLRAGTLPAGLHFAEVGTWRGAGDVEIDVVAVEEQGTAAGAFVLDKFAGVICRVSVPATASAPG